MKQNKSTGDNLRSRAEKASEPDGKSVGECSGEDMRRLLHELQIHQVELELQNEELRSAHARLEESRMRHADLYDFAPVGYFTLNRHGEILHLNLTAARQLGHEKARLINRRLTYFVSQADKKLFLSHLNAIFESREKQVVEVRMSPKQGEQFHARLESIYMEEKDGSGLCRVNMSDVTLHRRAEQALQNGHDELERCVQNRTAELANAYEELERARIELAHVDRVAILAELASSITHELGQPLTGTLTNAQTAIRLLSMDEPDLDEAQAALADIVKDTLRAHGVIQNLRSLLRKQVPGLTAIDFNMLVQDTVKLIASEAAKNSISVETDLASDLPQVMGNRVQLQQVLLNLILNGFHAMENHGRRCRKMTIRTSADDPGSVRVDVCDTGPGVDAGAMDHIFESFFTTKTEGLGMGLPICRTILKNHGGQLWTTRNPECGMTFCFSLPVGNTK